MRPAGPAPLVSATIITSRSGVGQPLTPALYLGVRTSTLLQLHGPRRNVKVVGRGAAEVFQGSNSGYTQYLWLSYDHRHAALPADALRFRCRISARMKTEKERPKRRLDIRKFHIMPQVSTPFGIFEIDPTDTSVSRVLQRLGEYGRREF